MDHAATHGSAIQPKNRRKQAKQSPIGIEAVQPKQIGPGRALLALVAQSFPRPPRATAHRHQDRGLPMQPQGLEREVASKPIRLKVHPTRKPKPEEMSCSTDKKRFLSTLAKQTQHLWRLPQLNPASRSRERAKCSSPAVLAPTSRQPSRTLAGRSLTLINPLVVRRHRPLRPCHFPR